MPKLFSRKGKSPEDDTMTISNISMGTSSVSDRIMGRMRMSLGGMSSRNLPSTDEGGSLDSDSNSGGRKTRRSFRSRPSFTRRMRSSSVGKLSMPMPGLDSANVRSGSSSSNVIDGMMAEMDSNETMALTGRSMGRHSVSMAAPPSRPSLARAPSAPALRSSSLADERFGNPRKAKTNLVKSKSSSKSSRRLKSTGGLETSPLEYSLAQLRQMSELDLEKTLDKAGVSSEEVDEAIDKVAAADINIATFAEEERKNALVMLLINSGKVKLVRADKARQESTSTLQTSNHPFEHSTNRASFYDETEASITSIPYNDEMNASVRSELSLSSSKRAERRKSKLDKIFELQTENSNLKRENKSLRKTVKNLLAQLTHMTQKEKETLAVAEKYKEEIESGASTKPEEGEQKINSVDDVKTKDKDDTSETLNRKDSDLSFNEIKLKLKAEKDAHKSTEFRLKAEIDLLTREVEGLQKQLAYSLKSIEKNEQSTKESREATSKLKRRLNHASSTISKLKNEAEARDKLIESFTKILLQKIGMNADSDNIDESTVGDDKMNLSMLEQSLKMSLAQDTNV